MRDNRTPTDVCGEATQVPVGDKVYCTKIIRTKTILTDNVFPFDRGKFMCLNVVG